MFKILRHSVLGLYFIPFFVAGFLWFIAKDMFGVGMFAAERMMDNDCDELIRR